MRSRSWYPWASAAAWGLVVFVLVLVNTGGSLLLAAVAGVVVAEISRRIALAAQRQEQRPTPEPPSADR